ncbi:MAG: hypothetical protein MUF50_03080 [Planctomycetes bacterium]|jgi:hypothetical protein|nr:hypothetical protein [Planctomycetota bacterium]
MDISIFLEVTFNEGEVKKMSDEDSTYDFKIRSLSDKSILITVPAQSNDFKANWVASCQALFIGDAFANVMMIMIDKQKFLALAQPQEALVAETVFSSWPSLVQQSIKAIERKEVETELYVRMRGFDYDSLDRTKEIQVNGNGLNFRIKRLSRLLSF